MSKRRSLEAVFSCSVAWAGLIAGAPVMAQDQTDDVAEAAPDDGAGEGIIVTGSRFSGRTVLKSPVPVDIVSADTLRSGGATELSQALAVSVPSLNFPPVLPASAFTATLRGFTYRGLPPSEVLILVNGKRWRPTSLASLSTFFDLNSLPSTAIDHVEVLRGGASAQYGSDAIAGVINLFLRKDVGTEMVATVGQHYAGDGETAEISLNSGWKLGEGTVHFTGYLRGTKPTSRQGRDVRQQYFARDPNGNPVILPIMSAADQRPILPEGFTFDPREATFDREGNFPFGDARRREAGLSINSELPLSDSVTAYLFSSYVRRNVRVNGAVRRPLDNNNVREIYPDGFYPSFVNKVSDFNATLGLRGQAGEFDWDFSQSYGVGTIKLSTDNSINVSLGPTSPTSFYRGLNGTKQATTNLDVRRNVDIGLREPLKVAVGTEFRYEGFKMGAGELASYANGGATVADGPNAGTPGAVGAQGSAGYRPADAVDVSRNSIAAYLDVENQLTSKLLITAAVRYENYSDFGSTVNGKFAFLEQITPGVALRGSVTTGFRAPALSESNFSQTSSFFTLGQFTFTRLLRVSEPAAVLLGAKPLKPEKSRSYSLGTTISAARGLTFTADIYRIDIDDTIIQSSFFNDAGSRGFLAANGFPDLTSASFAINGVDKRVEGIDLTGEYRTRFGADGLLTLNAAVNLNRPEVRRIAPTPAQLAAVTTIPLFNATEITKVEYAAPRSRINLSANVAIGGFGFLVRETRYGSVRSGAGPTFQKFGAKWLTDVEVTKEFGEKFIVSVGAQNLFDVKPDRLLPALNAGGLFKYSTDVTPFSFNGGFYYLRTRVKF